MLITSINANLTIQRAQKHNRLTKARDDETGPIPSISSDAVEPGQHESSPKRGVLVFVSGTSLSLAIRSFDLL